MYIRVTSPVFIAFILAISLQVSVNCQSSGSGLSLLSLDRVKDDSLKFELLCSLAENSLDLDTIIMYSDQAIALAEKLDLNPALAYASKGFGYVNSGNLDAALDCFVQAANYYSSEGNKLGMAGAYLSLAEVFNQQENYDNAKYYLKNAVEIFRDENEKWLLASALTNSGYTYYSMGQYDTALVLYSETSEIFQKLDSITEYAYCLGNIGLVYSGQGEYEKAEDYLLRAMEILSKEGDERALTEFMIEYAGVLQHKGEIEEAIASATMGFNRSVNSNFLEFERDAAKRLADLYRVSGKYDSAYHYQSVYISANDSIKDFKNVQKMAYLITKFEVSKKQTEVDVLERNKLIQLIVIISLMLILLLALGLIMLYYNSLKRSKKFTLALDERRILLEKQSTELKEQNEQIVKANEELKQLYELTNRQKLEIISSINYAQRMQSAILPPQEYINELLNENFIIYMPKDIVSGDFYWIKQVKHYTILVCADCTGHGVPAAFMSVLGISCLNEIVQSREITQANQILNELRKEIKYSLRQTWKKDETRDGMDMALCIIDRKNNTMQYSGAHNPLYIINNNNGSSEIREIKADAMPVGVHYLSDKSFTNHEVQLEIGDTFYIFSDGFIDQIGGENKRRFTSERFKQSLLAIYDKPLHEQKEILEETLKDWIGDHPQTDDILVIGARI